MICVDLFLMRKIVTKHLFEEGTEDNLSELSKVKSEYILQSQRPEQC